MVIELKSVTKVYNPGLFKKNVKALSNLSLSVRESEVFGLIGPNGAGKSTTIRLILGLSRPTSGEVLLQGSTLNQRKLLTNVGYLPENPYLYDHLTLNEVLLFSGVASGMDTKAIRKRSNMLMERFDLIPSAKRPLRTFSKGMMQRAGICFALIHDPSIIILDEPMSGLDPIGRKMVFDLVQELRAKGKTIFFCSHILNDVERLCDRIGLLDRGSVLEQYEMNDLYTNSQNQFIVSFSEINDQIVKCLKNNNIDIKEENGNFSILIDNVDFEKIFHIFDKSSISIESRVSNYFNLEEKFMSLVEGNKK